ncbi:hypothetical protein WIW50_08130 [Flavobacteriaceae bacterium 3-367]
MKTTTLLFFCLAIGVLTPLYGQDRIHIVVPTAMEETDQVWGAISDITFFEQQGYTLNLPKGRLIDTLITKSKSGDLTPADYTALKKFMAQQVYRQANYENGVRQIEAQKELLHGMLGQLEAKRLPWGFKEFPVYKVLLSLYGSGGSYNPDTGAIVVLTTVEGGFKQYRNPANTLIHEIVHIGLEYPIMEKYQVPHGLKERIVDRFVYLIFGEHLPEYKVQDMGDPRIDAHLRSIQDLDRLGEIVAQFLREH